MNHILCKQRPGSARASTSHTQRSTRASLAAAGHVATCWRCGRLRLTGAGWRRRRSRSPSRAARQPP
eukprot:3270784-Rhodomonas_salina.2